MTHAPRNGSRKFVNTGREDADSIRIEQDGSCGSQHGERSFAGGVIDARTWTDQERRVTRVRQQGVQSRRPESTVAP